MSQVLQPPTTEPAERRKFQLTNLDGNNNKFWMAEVWPLPDGKVLLRTTWGRVGASPQTADKVTTPWHVDSLIREKTGKGYQELDLHRPTLAVPDTAPGPRLPAKVERLLDWIYAEAGDMIASYLACGVDALSQEQIERGRKWLLLAQAHYAAWRQQQSAALFELLRGAVQSFYNTIPTQLPSRIDRQQIVLDFCQSLDEQEDRLNQLEAALATYSAVQAAPDLSRYDALGAEVALLPESDNRYQVIDDTITRTTVHGYRVKLRDVFTVHIPAERRAFEQNPYGRSRVELLFHGTASQNVRHILRSGLVCPRSPSHGRMFGHGIYFANKCSKSANYCSTRRPGVPHFMFLAQVALGNPYVAPDAMSDLREPPPGHDSVWGKEGHTGAWAGKLLFDEFIVYRAGQQSLHYLVTFDRA